MTFKELLNSVTFEEVAPCLLQMPPDAEHAFFTYSPEIHFYIPSSDFSDVLKNQYERLHSKFSRQGFGQLTEKYVKDDSPKVVVHTLPDFSGEISVDEETGFVYGKNGNVFVGIVDDKAKDIKTITISNHITSVSEDAFSVFSLEAVEKIVAPEAISAKLLYEYAKSCRTLKAIIAGKEEITIEDGIAYYNSYKEIVGVSNNTKIQSLVCKEGVETIASSAFEGHNELKSIKLPQTIKSISDRAFANTGITEIVFPFSLQKLGKEVFSSCNLSIVRFEGQIASGTNAFDGVKFAPSAYVKVQKIYKDEFIRKYPNLKNIVKTPLPKWLSWLVE